MANALSGQESQFIEVGITPKIEDEFVRRGVFEGIRRVNALRLRDGAWRYKVTREVAEALLRDATEQRRAGRPTGERGITTAYAALQRKLEWAGIQDPGARPKPASLDEAVPWQGGQLMQRIQADARLSAAILDAGSRSPARLQMGEKVFLERYDEAVEIVEGFGAFKVDQDEHFRLGYVARHSDGKEYFYPAGELTTRDRKPTYLRLVATA